MKKIDFNFALKNIDGVEYQENGQPIMAYKLLSNWLATSSKSEFVSETAFEMALKLNKTKELELSTIDLDKLLIFIESVEVFQVIKGQIKLNIHESRRNE